MTVPERENTEVSLDEEVPIFRVPALSIPIYVSTAETSEEMEYAPLNAALASAAFRNAVNVPTSVLLLTESEPETVNPPVPELLFPARLSTPVNSVALPVLSSVTEPASIKLPATVSVAVLRIPVTLSTFPEFPTEIGPLFSKLPVFSMPVKLTPFPEFPTEIVPSLSVVKLPVFPMPVYAVKSLMFLMVSCALLRTVTLPVFRSPAAVELFAAF